MLENFVGKDVYLSCLRGEIHSAESRNLPKKNDLPKVAKWDLPKI
jgi:hypothetical protein